MYRVWTQEVLDNIDYSYPSYSPPVSKDPNKVQWFGRPPNEDTWIPGPFDADLEKDSYDKFEAWKGKQLVKLVDEWKGRMEEVDKEVERQRAIIEELQEQLEDAEGQLGALQLSNKEEQLRAEVRAKQQHGQQIEDGVYHWDNTPMGGPANAAAGAGTTEATTLDQQQQLLNHFLKKQFTPQRKEQEPPKLSEQDAEKWLSFRIQFTRAAAMNGWPHQHAINKLIMSVVDAAGKATEHLSLPEGPSLQEALNRYEEIFVNPAGADIAEVKFEESKRKSSEDVLAWHNRARTLFNRAYPGETAETSKKLKDHFVLRLGSREVAKNIRDSPQYAYYTYTEVLTRARQLVASDVLISSHFGGGGQSKTRIAALAGLSAEEAEGGVHAMGNGNKKGCFHCGSLDHVIKECTQFRKHAKFAGYQPREESEGHKSASSTAAVSGGAPKAQGRGQRGGARGRGRGGRWGRGGKARGGHQSQVNALDGNATGGNQGSDTEPEPEN